MSALLVARFFHFLGFISWLGGLAAALGLLGLRARETDEMMQDRLSAAARATMRVTELGMTLAIAGGVYMAVVGDVFKQPWLHVKLTLVALLLALTVVTRIKSRNGAILQVKRLFPALLVLVAGILYLVIFRPLTAR